jgi:hypothetical protein
MIIRLSILLSLCSLISSCDSNVSTEKHKKSNKQDLMFFLNTELSMQADTTLYVERDVILNYFDSIPNHLGENLIDLYGNDGMIEEERDFLVLLPVDSINFIKIARTNLRLDPYNKYSDSTYFFLIGYYSGTTPMGLTWLVDFEREVLSVWRYPHEDSLRYIKQREYLELQIDTNFTKLISDE